MDRLKLALLFFAWFTNVGTIVVCYLRKHDMKGLYENTKHNLSQKYSHELLPNYAFFWVSWPVVFLWNLVGITYLLVSAFSHSKLSPVNGDSPLVPKLFVVSHILAFGLVMPWEVSFDRENLDLCLALIMLASLFSYIATGFSYYHVRLNILDLKQSNPRMLWCFVILVQNGLALYAANLSVAATLNMAEVVIYCSRTDGMEVKLRGLLSDEDASTLSLATFLTVMVIWFVLENHWWREYCRYVLTIYPVFIFASASVLSEMVQLHPGSQNIVVTSVILGLATVMMTFRIVVLCLGKFPFESPV